MKDIKLKVCGLRDNIDEVVKLDPDFIGFIFYDKSKRYVNGIDNSILKNIQSRAKKVGVFVNATINELLKTQADFKLDYVQLHGEEPVGYCKELKEEGIKIIKVFSGNKLPDYEILDGYAPYIDFYLFDTRGASYGGSGKRFNWRNLAQLRLKKPVFLSGGIDLEAVNELMSSSELDIYAIDVNSKFEIEPGLKDIKKLEALKEVLL